MTLTLFVAMVSSTMQRVATGTTTSSRIQEWIPQKLSSILKIPTTTTGKKQTLKDLLLLYPIRFAFTKVAHGKTLLTGCHLVQEDILTRTLLLLPSVSVAL